jgi:hypothetical protein
MKESEKRAKEQIAKLRDYKGNGVVTNKRGGGHLNGHTGDAKTIKDGIIRRNLGLPPRGH